MSTAIDFGPAPLRLVCPLDAKANDWGGLAARGRLLPRTVVRAELSEEGIFSADFEVSSPEKLFLNESLQRNSPQQGLWHWDVVEVFIQPDTSPPYYEFQASPLGQYFELQVFEPRKRTNPMFRSGVEVAARILEPRSPLDACRWTASMKVDLERLGWKKASSRARWNCFAILGDPGSRAGRSYWSLTLPPQATPDFHLPRHFAALR